MSAIRIRRLPGTLLPLLAVACAHLQPRTESMENAGVEASQVELQTDVLALGHETMRQIEMAADSIDSLTTDPIVRRNTLLLRISSVPATTEAVLRPDLVISMLDLYAFQLQLSDFFASPAGLAALGDHATVAQDAMVRLRAEWGDVVATVGGNLPDTTRAKLAAWARQHPIDRLPFTRSSLAGPLAIRLRSENGSLSAAVGGLQGTLGRLEARASLANEYLVKQVGWMARLTALDARGSPEALELTGTLRSTRELIASAPGLLDRQRTAMLADIDRQRRETLSVLGQERAILLSAIEEQRELVLLAADEQRRYLVRDADVLRAQIASDVDRAVDRLILRLAELLAGLLLVLGAWSLLRRRLQPRA